MRGEPGEQRLSVVDIGTGTVVGQLGFTGKKEYAGVSALRPKICGFDPGTFVMADALHTNRSTAHLCLDNGLYYGFIVKGNQATLLDQLEQHDWC